MIEEYKMVSLPAEWKCAKLGEVCKTTSGGTPSRKVAEYYDGNIPWLKSGELNDGVVSASEEFISEEGLKNSSAKVFPKDTLLIALYGATVGRLAILGIDAATNQAICGIFPSSSIQQKFLYWYLFSQREVLLGQRVGGAQPNISQDILRNIYLPLPPLDEQQRIVARIEELFTQLDAGVAALEAVRAQVKRYRQAVLQAAVSGNFEKDGKPIFDTTVCRKVLLKDVCSLDVGFAFKSAEFADNGIRLLRGENIEPGSLRWEEIKYWPTEKVAPYKNLFITEGDVILAMDRPIISSGIKLAKAKAIDLPCLLVQRMARFNSNQPLSSNFLYIVLSSQSFSNHLKGTQTGTQLPHISANNILSFEFFLPSLEIQNWVSEKVEQLLSINDQMEKSIDQSLQQAARLRQSILQRAFTGKL